MALGLKGLISITENISVRQAVRKKHCSASHKEALAFIIAKKDSKRFHEVGLY